MPNFRSEAQARILAWLLLVPDREQPIATLAPAAGVAQPNTLFEANRLEGGLLRERRASNTRLVAANTASPYSEPQVQILGRGLQSRPRCTAGAVGAVRHWASGDRWCLGAALSRRDPRAPGRR